MRAAPAVSIELTGSLLWRGACAALGALTAAALAALAAGHAESGDAATLGTTLVAAALGLALGHRLADDARGRLRWDGASWWWQEHGATDRDGELSVAIDLGGWMLLRFRPHGRPGSARWLPVPARRLEADAVALRAAVYCRRLEAPPPPRR